MDADAEWPAPKVPAGDHRRQKILVVDDLEENILAMCTVLAGVDADLVTCTSGEAALAATLDHDFAVALLDVMMPGMNGYELAELLRGDARTAVLPILFLTASHLDELSMFKGYEAGGVDYILKPIASQVLISKVEWFLELDRYRRRLDELVRDRTRRLEHLSRVLLGVRNVNQLIVREKDPAKLIRDACRTLVEARGFPGAWVALTDAAGVLVDVAGAGSVARPGALEAWLAQGWLPACCQTMAGDTGSRVSELARDCPDCPLATSYGVARSVTSVLVHHGRRYGFMNVAVPDGQEVDAEELSLLDEAAGDVAFALFALEQGRERAQATQLLRESEQRFEAFFDRSPDYCYMVGPDARIQDANHAMCAVLGRPRGELVGSPVDTIYAPESRGRATELRQRWLAGERIENQELEIVAADGRRRTVLLSASMVCDGDGRPLHSVSIQRDITEHRALEQQIATKNKLEAIGRLAGGVAHDFNNQLQVIKTLSELVAAELPTSSAIAGKVDEIRQAAARAAALTRQLLAFSRRQVLAPEVLNINATVRDLGDMLRRMLREDVDLETALDPELWNVRADPAQLEQVISNLVVNARDAMPGRGAITLETANVRLDGEYARTHADAAPGEYVMVAVSDTGCGMDAATRARVFEPFFTTKPSGTGLGLATVFGIVGQSGGHVACYSEPGEGTTFKVYLPRVPGGPRGSCSGRGAIDGRR